MNEEDTTMKLSLISPGTRSRLAAMKLRARAIAAAWRGDAEASDRLLRAASDAEQKTEPAA